MMAWRKEGRRKRRKEDRITKEGIMRRGSRMTEEERMTNEANR